MPQPPNLQGKGLDANPQNRINKPKNAFHRSTLFKRARKEAIARGDVDPLLRIIEAMLKKAESGDVAAANLILDNMFGKLTDKSNVKHSGNLSLVELVAASIKKEKEQN